ncbi:Nuclear cap-binding protein subunit 1 [Armadillidium vulgare]|nr:Nuclear cap-binding protein subunit 1 [Armadillidium vulgare]
MLGIVVNILEISRKFECDVLHTLLYLPTTKQGTGLQISSTSSLESNLEGLASVLEADIINYKGKILKILSECAVKMPEKTTIYTTLVGLLNAKNYNFGGEFMDLMTRKLKEALERMYVENGQIHCKIFC